MLSGHILDLYYVWLSNTAPFCENYAKFYFDAKHLEKGLNVCVCVGGGGLFSKNVPIFHKKVPFLANIEGYPKFLEYALTVKLIY